MCFDQKYTYNTTSESLIKPVKLTKRHGNDQFGGPLRHYIRCVLVVSMVLHEFKDSPSALSINTLRQNMERNEQGWPKILHLRACFKHSEILAEATKILGFQEKSKIKNRLLSVFSLQWCKKNWKKSLFSFLEMLMFLASSRQCDFTFSGKTKPIIYAGELTPKLELFRKILDFDEL